MKEIIFLGSLNYDNPNNNYGDCILINTGTDLVIYDCGHKEHAIQVINYMDKNNFSKATLVLSHNDSDHFDGIPHLLEKEKIKAIHTVLLLKHVDDILDEIGDRRRNRETIKEAILKEYDNIASLSGNNLIDIYKEDKTINSHVVDGVRIVGPEYDYMINAVAKQLDNREGDIIDLETAVNATSIQVEVEIGGQTLLLCGDCSFAAIEDKVREYSLVQLPHHGKQEQGESIFEKKSDQLEDIYFISDNTGNAVGGSEGLDITGYNVHNTKTSNSIQIDNEFLRSQSSNTGRVLG